MSQAYVKYLIKAYEIVKSGGSVTPKSLGEALGVSRPTAFEYIQKFVKIGFVVKIGKGYSLTERGKREAKRFIRKHRIIETLLYRNGVDLEKACECAYRIQGAIDDDVVEKIFVSIGCPKFCPHGREIPDAHIRNGH